MRSRTQRWERAMTSDLIRALQRSRGCITGLLARTPVRDVTETLAEIDFALAAAQQAEPTSEPVAWANPGDLINDGHGHALTVLSSEPGTVNYVPLYTHPPRPAVRLTEEEIGRIALGAGCNPEWDDGMLVCDIARAVESAVLQKNGITGDEK